MIAEVLGLGPRSVTVRADHESSGHTIIPDAWDVSDDKARRGRAARVGIDAIRRGRILALMAGRAAEEECLGFRPGGEGGDDRMIGLELDDLPEGDARLDRMRRLIRGLVRKHRLAIERVANELERHRELDGETIRRLVRGPGRGD